MSKAWFTRSGSFASTTFLQTLSGLVSAKILIDHGFREVRSFSILRMLRGCRAPLVGKNGRFG